MAGAIIIACAMGVLMLVLVGYVMVGSTLTSDNSIASAQKDMTALKEERLRTNIEVTWADYHGTGTWIEFTVDNTGNERIPDLTQVNIVLITGSNAPVYYINGSGYGKTWKFNSLTPDTIHPNQWDPGEELYAEIYEVSPKPSTLMVVTANGVTNQTSTII